MPHASPPTTRSRMLELAQVFVRLGFTGFGGPAATIAMMEDEAVTRRGWLTRAHFLDLVGITNLIPGANAVEMSLHLGHLRAGLPGLLVSGACFILPAATISALFAWAYVRYGALPQVGAFLYGIKPVVLGVILAAIFRLGRSALANGPLLGIALGVVALSYCGVNEVLALFAGGLLGMLALRWRARACDGPGAGALGLLTLGPLYAHAPSPLLDHAQKVAPSVWRLALFMLKVGAVLYGSGYVLAAFLEGGLVRDYGWLTQQQLLDAIAVGQITPGPLLSTSSFIGFLLYGARGAALCTAAIFAPSFVFVLATVRLVARLRRSAWACAFLDAINASSLTLMVIVMVRLGHAALVDWPAILIACAGALAALRWKVNSTWLVLAGGLAGWLISLMT